MLREFFPAQHNFLSAGKSREALDLRKILTPLSGAVGTGAKIFIDSAQV